MSDLTDRINNTVASLDEKDVISFYAVKTMLTEAAEALRDLQADADIHDEQLTKVARLRLELESENIKLQAVAEAAEFVVARYTGGCETFIAPANCVSAGRKRDAEYGADQWCDVCVLREALAKLDKRVQPLASEEE